MSKENYEKERRIIKSLAIRNGYNVDLIDKLVNKMKTKKPTPDQKPEYICIPYSSVMNKAVSKTFKNSNLKVSFRTKNNAFKIIKNNTNQNKKQKKDVYEKTGIYKIKCTKCPKFYIGQTGRNFRCRYKEHIQCIKSNNMTSQKSAFAEHILDTLHEYKSVENNVEVLDILPKGEKMNSVEELHIYLAQKRNKENLLNVIQVQKQNPIFDKIEEINNKT